MLNMHRNRIEFLIMERKSRTITYNLPLQLDGSLGGTIVDDNLVDSSISGSQPTRTQEKLVVERHRDPTKPFRTTLWPP